MIQYLKVKGFILLLHVLEVQLQISVENSTTATGIFNGFHSLSAKIEEYLFKIVTIGLLSVKISFSEWILLAF
jgi:hypothetical protein